MLAQRRKFPLRSASSIGASPPEYKGTGAGTVAAVCRWDREAKTKVSKLAAAAERSWTWCLNFFSP